MLIKEKRVYYYRKIKKYNGHFFWLYISCVTLIIVLLNF